MFETKQNYRYNIQYHFIPELVEVVSKRILLSAVFTMFDIWERILKDKYGSDFELEQGYNCEVIKVNERYNIYFFTFPEPDYCPEALYGAVIIDNQENALQYYTLEMSFDGSWVIGSKTQERHYNYGELDSRNPEAFIDWLSNKLK